MGQGDTKQNRNNNLQSSGASELQSGFQAIQNAYGEFLHCKFSSWFSPRQSRKAAKSNLSLSGSARQKSDDVAIKHHQRAV